MPNLDYANPLFHSDFSTIKSGSPITYTATETSYMMGSFQSFFSNITVSINGTVVIATRYASDSTDTVDIPLMRLEAGDVVTITSTYSNVEGCIGVVNVFPIRN